VRYIGYYTTGAVNNAGTFNRSGVGRTQGISFANSGTLNVNAGAFEFYDGGSTGTINVAAGATARVVSGSANTVFNGGTIANAGTFEIGGGTLRIQSAPTYSGNGTFRMAGGTVRVDNGQTLTVTNLNFTNGFVGGSAINNNGTLVANGTHTFDGTNSQYVGYGATLTLNGSTTWSAGNGYVYVGWPGGASSGTLNIAAGATFADQGVAAGNPTGLRYLGWYTTGAVNNAGTYTRSGVGRTQGINFNNSGTLNVNSGAFEFYAGGSTGTINVAAGATARVVSGGSADTILNGGTIANAGAFEVSSGTLRVQSAPGYSGSGLFTMNGGSLRIDNGQTFTVTNVNLVSGVVGGSAINNNGTLVVNDTATIDGTSFPAVGYGATLTLNGNTTWAAGNGYTYVGYASTAGTLNIGVGAAFADLGVAANNPGGTRYFGYYTTGVINNAGIYNRSGVGTTQLNGTFNNSGTVNVTAGVLSFAGPTNNAGGLLNATSSGVLRLDGGVIAGGNITTSSGGVFRANTNGGNFWDGVAFNGTLDMASVSVLRVRNGLVFNGTGTIDNGSYLALEGVQTVSGSGTLVFGSNTNNRIGVDVANANATIGSGITIRGQNGAIGDVVYVGGTNRTLTNQGTISADVSGGTILFRSSLRLQNDGLIEAANGGAINMDGSVSLLNNLAGNLTGGHWRADGSGSTITLRGTHVATNTADVTLRGVGSVIQTTNPSNITQTLDQSLTTNAAGGTLRIQNGRVFNAAANSGNFTNAGLLELTGGTFTSSTLASNGSIVGLGTSTVTTGAGNQISGSGAITAQTGTLTITRGVNMGTGSSLTSVAGATVDLASATAASRIGTLANNGSLALGGQNIVVTKDYTNANFGSGNAFDSRANVSGSGVIIGNNASQTLTGNVTSLGANTWGLNIGNVRGGTTSNATFQIANNGTGADIRGAVQTAAGGASITDARVSGSGVTAGNFGPIAAGANSGNLTVTLSGNGTGGALAGQTIAIVSNFGNVATQSVQLSGFTSVLATGGATPAGPVNLGNFRVGSVGALQSFAVANQVSGPGSERLGIDSVTASGGFLASNVLGSGLIAGGGSSSGAVTARASGTGVAGANGGTITISYATDGTAIDAAFTRQASNTQVINVNATGYNAAVGAATPTPIVFANMRVNAAHEQVLTIGNNAAPGLFSEDLRATVGGVSGAAQTNGGSVASLTAGNTSSGAIRVNLDNSSAGAKSGTVTLNYETLGTVQGATIAGLGVASVGNQVINVSGNVYRLASGAVNGAPVDLGAFRVGGTLPGSQSVGVSNNAAADGFSEQLGIASVSSASALFTAANALGSTRVNAGASAAGAVSIGAGTGLVAGVNSGQVTVQFLSDGTVTSSGAPINVNSANVNVSATGYNAAAGSATPSPVTIANQRIGGSLTQALTVTNTAAPGSFSEDLNVALGTIGGSATASGSIAGRVAGTNNTGTGAISVGVNTGAAGARSGSVTLNYQTAGAVAGVSNGLGTASAGSQTINVSGNVYQVAQPTPSALPATVNLGNFRAGSGAQTQTISIANTSAGAPAGFQEGLNAVIGTTGGGGTGTGFTNAAVGTSGSLVVGLAGIAAGNNSGTVQVQLQSSGITTGGDTGLGTLNLGGAQTVTVNGTGWRLAQAGTLPVTINFGNVLVGSAPTQLLNIQNTAANDGFSERLDAFFKAGGTTGDASNNGGSVSLLAAGASNNASMSVGINTGSIGAKSGQVIVSFNSNGSGTSGLGITGLADQTLGLLANVQANVGTLAQPSQVAPNPVNFGNLRVGASAPAPVSLTISNLATVGEGLNASIASGSAGFGATGSFTSLAPGATDSSTLKVSFSDTATAGAKSGTATVTLVSDGTFNGGTTTPLPSQTVQMNANVYRLASGAVNGTPVDLGAFRVGGALPSTQVISVTNTAAADGFSEQLGIQGVSSGNGLFTAANTLGGTRVNAGATAAGAVSIGAGTGLGAGVNNGSVTVQFLSDGTATASGAPIAVNSQNFNVTATGYNAAAGAASPSTINLGNFRVGQAGGAAPQSQNVAVSNTVAGPFTESLGIGSASVNNAAFALTNNLGSGLIAAGTANTSALNVARSGGVAGVNTGTLAIQYTSDGAGTSGLSAINVNSQNVTVNATGYQAASGVINTAPLNFGTVQVGQAVSQVLSISNVATGAAGFVEDLNASFGASSGTGAGLISGAGSISGLLAGATNNTGMTVSVNTAAAGSVNGAIAVNFVSAGAVAGVANGLGALDLGSVAYGLQGLIQANVINTASPVINTSQPINLGNVRIGAASPTAFVSVTNQATTAPQAALNASIAGNAPITASGSFALLDPGSTNANALRVGMNTGTAGAVNGTATVGFVSDASNVGGCGSNCQLNLPSQNVTVTGGVYQVAQASVPTSVNLGNFRLGSAPGQAITIANTDISPAGFQEGLDASVAGTSGKATASGGPIANLAQGASSGAIAVGINNASAAAGINTGQVTISLASNGSNTSGLVTLALPSATVDVSGTGYRVANPTVNTPSVTLAARVGDASPSAGVSITNTSADLFTEGLKASIGTASAGFSATGSIANLASQGTDAGTLRVGLNTSTAGSFNGSAALTLASTGAGTTGAADLALAGQSVALAGKVYTTAVGAATGTAIDFGVVRVGDTVSARNIVINNTAATTALNDTLRADLSGVGGPFTGNGANVAGIGAQASGTLAVGLNTGTAGLFNATGMVSFLSQNVDLADVSAGPSANVTLTAQVNNLANADFDLLSGLGALTQTGTNYLLDLGTVNLGATLNALLQLDNEVAGPADLLSGAFDLSQANDFGYTNWDPVSGLGAGEAFGGLSVNWTAAALGLYTDTIVFNGLGTNAADPTGLAQARQLLIRANVVQGGSNVPEPGTFALLAAAAAAGLVAGRRRRVVH
jgi:hypothetical protein